VSGGLFNLFQMTQQEEDVLSLEDSGSEYFDTAEAGSSADETTILLLPGDACGNPSRQNLPWPLPLPVLPLHIRHDTILCTRHT
jgi:hypothetical protein